MRNVRSSRLHTLLLAALAIAAAVSGCHGDTDGIATAAMPPDSDAAVDGINAMPATGNMRGAVRFTSGTSYAATGAQSEIALNASDARALDVLVHIAGASGVPLEIADGVDLDHRVSLHFDGMPLSAVLTLLGQEANALITAEADAIRVRPHVPAGQ
ncbi:MAG: hypothetical protein ACJ8GV_14610 [Luteimonas sp.]